MRSPSIRSERGIALLTTLLVIIAVGAITLAAVMMTLNANLVTKNGERISNVDAAAVAGLEEGRSRLNGNKTLYPTSGYTTLESNAIVKDAGNTAIPKVTRSTYIGPSGMISGQYGDRGQPHFGRPGQLRQPCRPPPRSEPGELLQVRLLHQRRARHLGHDPELHERRRDPGPGPLQRYDPDRLVRRDLHRPGVHRLQYHQRPGQRHLQQATPDWRGPDSDADRGRPQQAGQPGQLRWHQVRRLHRRRHRPGPHPGRVRDHQPGPRLRLPGLLPGVPGHQRGVHLGQPAVGFAVPRDFLQLRRRQRWRLPRGH